MHGGSRRPGCSRLRMRAGRGRPVCFSVRCVELEAGLLPLVLRMRAGSCRPSYFCFRLRMRAEEVLPLLFEVHSPRGILGVVGAGCGPLGQTELTLPGLHLHLPACLAILGCSAGGIREQSRRDLWLCISKLGILAVDCLFAYTSGLVAQNPTNRQP